MMDIFFWVGLLIYVMGGLLTVRQYHFRYPLEPIKIHPGTWMTEEYTTGGLTQWAVLGRLLAFALWPLYLLVWTAFPIIGLVLSKTVVPLWVWFFTNPEQRRAAKEAELEAKRKLTIRDAYDIAIELYGDGTHPMGRELARMQVKMTEQLGPFEYLPGRDKDTYDFRRKKGILWNAAKSEEEYLRAHQDQQELEEQVEEIIAMKKKAPLGYKRWK